jgi:hypothetical protein
MNQPHDPGAHPLATPRHPEYVIKLWVSEQVRELIKRNNAAIAQDQQDPRWPGGRKAEPQPELEAEP